MANTKRRSVLKLAGGTALGGMAGILATGRTPAYAQQKTVHWLKWVDFVPATDQMFRREMMPQAEKDLGIKVNLETVNGNDLQPRITAGIQSGAGPDIIMSFNSYTHLYANSVVDMGALAEEVGKREGGIYKYAQAICSNGKGVYMGMPWAVIGGMIAYRKSWLDEVGATKFPDTWESYREVAKKLKAKGRPFGQTLGHTFGDAPGFTYPYMWSWGGKEVEADGKTVVINSKETVEFGQVHDRPVEGRHGRGRPRLGRHQQQPCLPVADHLGDAERRLDLHRIAAQARPVQDRQGRAAEQGHPARAAAQGPGRAVRLPSAAVQHADEVFEEPGRREAVPEAGSTRRPTTASSSNRRRASPRRARPSGRATSCGTSIRS